MLKVKDLNVSYGAIHAIHDVSLEVNAGEIVSLIGANGAGKTTTLHTITEEGVIRIRRAGRAQPSDNRAIKDCRSWDGACPGGAAYFRIDDG